MKIMNLMKIYFLTKRVEQRVEQGYITKYLIIKINSLLLN